jgi:hypothetical protein
VPDCGCLDYRVFGHQCGSDGQPPPRLRMNQHELASMRDPSPRPVPYSEPELPPGALLRRILSGRRR